MKKLANFLWMIPLMTAFVSCTEEKVVEMYVPGTADKPESVAESEFLASYNLLNTYINTATTPDLKLGAVLSLDDFTKRGKAYAQVKTNLGEVTPDSVMLYGKTMADDGETDFHDTEEFIETALAETGISVFGNTLCWYKAQNVKRLENLVAPIERGGVVTIDFDEYEEGATFEMNGIDSQTGKPTSTVEYVDGNKAIHVEGAFQKWFPQFTFQLPTMDDGYEVIFSDCDSLVFDYKNMNGDNGEQGLRVMFGNRWPGWVSGANNGMTSTSKFGAANDGTWYRDVIRIPIHDIYNFSDSEKALHTVTPLGIGVDLRRNCDYYMDNLRLYWSLDPKIQTEEEKSAKLCEEFKTWVTGLMEACDGHVTSWDIVTDPLVTSSTVGSSSTETDTETSGETETTVPENFFWEEQMGENYARELVKIAREAAGETSLLLYVNNLFDMGETNDVEAEVGRLLAKINGWEADGTTKIDGINIRLHTPCSLDLDELHAYEYRIMLLFQALAESGKRVKISDLTLNLVDYSGNPISVSNLTFEEQARLGAFYNYIVREYINAFGANATGISFGSLFETEGGNKVCLWDVDRNRTPSYAGVAEALQGNTVTADDLIEMSTKATGTNN